jgi:hypothetical protein
VPPAAAPGILTGSCRRSRAAGETAPPLFKFRHQFKSTTSCSPSSLPQLIFRNTIEVQTPQSLQLARGGPGAGGDDPGANWIARAVAMRARVGERDEPRRPIDPRPGAGGARRAAGLAPAGTPLPMQAIGWGPGSAATTSSRIN